MLQLDPAHPPLWRTPSTLQFGVDPVAVVEDPEPWQLRLISELAIGIPATAVEPVACAFGAPDDAAAPFLRVIARALSRRRGSSTAHVTLQVPSDLGRNLVDALADALMASGQDVTIAHWHGVPDEAVPDASSPVIVVAHQLVEPRRSAALLSRDIAHLPIVFTGDRVEVGPFVQPGRSACLSCVAAHRTDEDPAWPMLMAQLLGRPSAHVQPAWASEAGLVAARLLNDAALHPLRQANHSVTLLAHSLHRRVRSHRPHAACRCRSLAGIEKAGDLAVLPTTTARAYAVPA